VNPITLRQTFQAANFEAIREAQGFNDALVREAGNKKLLQEQNALQQDNVPEIPKTEAMRTEERKGRERGSRRERQGARGTEEEAEASQEESASSADGHLDLLA
jgi:hypothetical protein